MVSWKKKFIQTNLKVFKMAQIEFVSLREVFTDSSNRLGAGIRGSKRCFYALGSERARQIHACTTERRKVESCWLSYMWMTAWLQLQGKKTLTHYCNVSERISRLPISRLGTS